MTLFVLIIFSNNFLISGHQTQCQIDEHLDEWIFSIHMKGREYWQGNLRDQFTMKSFSFLDPALSLVHYGGKYLVDILGLQLTSSWLG